MRPLTVVVAHREPLMAEALAAALGGFSWLAPVAVASTARDAIESAGRADALALDRRLPGAVSAAARLRKQGVRIVLITDGAGEAKNADPRGSNGNEAALRRTIGNGSNGRNGDGNGRGNGHSQDGPSGNGHASPSDAADAPAQGDGITVSSSDSISTLALALAPTRPNEDEPALPLTKRQREILELVAKGLAGKQVARQLGISPKTVERHKTRMFARLGVVNQTAAVSVALGDGIGRSGVWSQSSI